MANVIIKQMTGTNGTPLIAPLTPEKAIYDENGKFLSAKMAQVESDLAKAKSSAQTAEAKAEAINEQLAAIISGSTSPDVTALAATVAANKAEVDQEIGVNKIKTLDTIAASTSYTLYDISVKTGEKITITFSGSAVWTRVYLFYNGDVQKRIGDTVYMNNNSYEYTAAEDITALSLRVVSLTTAGDVTVNVVKKGNLTDVIANKVDKVDGKELSTNDYTDEDKTSLEVLKAVLDVVDKEDDYVKADFSNEDTVLGTNGVVRSGANYLTTDYIALPSGITKIVAFAKFDGAGNSGLSFYNENKVCLKNFVNVSTDKNYTIEADEIPDGTAYFIACQHKSYDAFVKVYYQEKSGELIDLKEDVEEAKTKAEKTIEFTCTPKLVNPIANLQKSNLRILDIGNSFSNYPTMYIKPILQNAITRGAIASVNDVAEYNLTMTGSQFRHWVNLKNNVGTSEYTFEAKWDAGSIVESPTYREVGTAGDNTLLMKVLTQYKWDIILIHQRSLYSAEYKQWEGNEDSGYLKEFVQILKMYQPQASVGFTLVHSVSKNFSQNPEGSTSLRWQHICDGVKFMQTNYGIDFVIPYGTALENLRKTSVNNADSELTGDLTHPGFGLAAYACNLVYFHCIYGQRYGLLIKDDTYTPDISSQKASAAYPNGCVEITDANRPLAWKAALFAVTDMFTLHNPEEENI